MRCEFKKVTATRNHLVVRFTIKDQVVAQEHRVTIPWAELLGEYESLMNGIESAALKRLGPHLGQYELPLEKWE